MTEAARAGSHDGAAPEARSGSGDAWLELLLTDSLDRPLGSAPYLLESGGEVARGRLTPDGRLQIAWPAEADSAREGGFVPSMRLLVCHRTLVIGRGPAEGDRFTRNRLTNAGFDAGAPDAPLEPARVASAYAAFERAARGEAFMTGDAASMLDAWCTGEAGVARVLPGAANRFVSRAFVKRWRTLSAWRTRRALVEPVRSGSHLAELEDSGVGLVAIAVTVGPSGSRISKNRVVVYDWFSGYGTPPREGNAATPLIDGEETWGALAADIEQATTELCVSSWFLDPDIELVRPRELALANPDRRGAHCFSTLVDGFARRGGVTSILLWNWVGTPLLHPTLRRWAFTPDDGVEVLQHAHPSLLGSFHEKTIVVDRRIAYCGGFNLRQNDWDAQGHGLDEPRRNPHGMSGWDRRRPEPLYPPRHDLAIRLEGPIVADLHSNFTRHWNGTLRRERRALRRLFGKLTAVLTGAVCATPVHPIEKPPEPSGTVLAQFVRTDPRLPKRQQAIVDVTLRAIANARRLIYIENQFFRSPRVAEVIVTAMRRRPRLQVIVVTNQVRPLRELNPQAYWTHLVQETLRAERPDFTLYELVARGEIDGALEYRPVFIHAKVMVVDDEWATVGSANINDRSIYSEFEANVAVEDAPFAAKLRRRLMAEHLGLAGGEDPRLADLDEAAALWRALAEENAESRRGRRPARGLAHPFRQEGALRWLRGRPEWF